MKWTGALEVAQGLPGVPPSTAGRQDLAHSALRVHIAQVCKPLQGGSAGFQLRNSVADGTVPPCTRSALAAQWSSAVCAGILQCSCAPDQALSAAGKNMACART